MVSLSCVGSHYARPGKMRPTARYRHWNKAQFAELGKRGAATQAAKRKKPAPPTK